MRILKNDCTFLMIDFQDRLMPHMHEKEELLKKAIILVQGLCTLEIPITVTEQYTKGLGFTIESLKALLPEYSGMEKTSFSCCDDLMITQKIKSMQKKIIIIAGIEAHVCVMQTANDLIEQGYTPVIVEDCISSRNLNDKKIAIQRMMQSGALVTTCESILFELTRNAGNDLFKSISKLVK